MAEAEIDISRISKLFIDRDEMGPDEALSLRQDAGLILRVGNDVATSRALQLALFTAVEIGEPCFPGGLRLVASARLFAAPVLVPHARRCNWGGSARNRTDHRERLGIEGVEP